LSRLFLALIFSCALVLLPPLPTLANPVAKADDPKQFTVEQVVESVILIYGTRPGLEQVRRFGIERGKITRFLAEGNTEEASYERKFVRGENLDKDKIRLDQKMPTMEYSLIYGGGKLWGLINGAAFTPRQDAAANFISQHHHSIDSLLRYKECGYTVSMVGKEKQKGLDLYVVDSLILTNGRPVTTSAHDHYASCGWSMKRPVAREQHRLNTPRGFSTIAQFNRHSCPIASSSSRMDARVRRRAFSP
jgi:hypothetical protein